MAKSLSPLTVASIVFLVLYLFIFIILLGSLATKRILWRSHWYIVIFHIVLRVAAQAVGIAFGVLSFRARNLLVAYLVLATEGYFTLVLSLALFFVYWQRQTAGSSWLARDDLQRDRSGRSELSRHILPTAFLTKPIEAMQVLLVVANVLIITGSSLLASHTPTGPDGKPVVSPGPLRTARAMRGTRQGVFLLCNLTICTCLVWTMMRYGRIDQQEGEFASRSRSGTLPPSVHSLPARVRKGHSRVLVLFLVISGLLSLRGAFGVAQALAWRLNYYNANLYNSQGFVSSYVAEETVLATLPEWLSCSALIITGLVGERKEEGYENTYRCMADRESYTV